MSVPLKMMELYTSLLGGICGPVARRPSVPNDCTARGRGVGGRSAPRGSGRKARNPRGRSADRERGRRTLRERQGAVLLVEVVQDARVPDIRLRYQVELFADVIVHHGARARPRLVSAPRRCDPRAVDRRRDLDPGFQSARNCSAGGDRRSRDFLPRHPRGVGFFVLHRARLPHLRVRARGRRCRRRRRSASPRRCASPRPRPRRLGARAARGDQVPALRAPADALELRRASRRAPRRRRTRRARPRERR